MFRNMIFPNLLSEILYYVGFLGLMLGTVVFIAQVLKRDSLYEALIAWPVRLLIYTRSAISRLLPPRGVRSRATSSFCGKEVCDPLHCASKSNASDEVFALLISRCAQRLTCP